MCNHYRNHPELLSTWREYIRWDLYDPLPQPDIWPNRPATVVRMVAGKESPETMTWGIPIKMAGKRPGTTVTKHITNVRNLASSFWRPMLNHTAQRCLVPFNSFAEPVSGRKEHWFSLPDQPVAAFAGIWRKNEAEHVFAFLTCEPNSLVAPLHPKAMPVILDPPDYRKWLTADFDEARTLVAPYPSQLMAIVPTDCG
nr:SOS response-associated peptidase family protein [uncultured Sphingomonas sp.]